MFMPNYRIYSPTVSLFLCALLAVADQRAKIQIDERSQQICCDALNESRARHFSMFAEIITMISFSVIRPLATR